MFNQKELIAYLRANNISMVNRTAVERGLMSMKWPADDVASALILLESANVFSAPPTQTVVAPGQLKTAPAPVSRATTRQVSSGRAPRRHKIRSSRSLYTNQRLDPATITSLLGVDVDFTEKVVASRRVLRTPKMSTLDQVVALTIALIIAAGILLGAMYHYEFGLFHTSSQFAIRLPF